MRADRTLFARLAVVAQSRSLDMRSVLHCELGPVPWSLATPDGGLVKTDKSCLLHLLKSGTQPVEDVPPMSALILDGMAVLQTTRPTGDTFSHLADQVFRYATQADEWILLLTGICRSASSRQSVNVGLQLACYGSKLINPINDCQTGKSFLPFPITK